MRDTHTERGRERSRLLAEIPMQNSIPGPQDHYLSQRQMLNHWATQAPQISTFWDSPFQSPIHMKWYLFLGSRGEASNFSVMGFLCCEVGLLPLCRCAWGTPALSLPTWGRMVSHPHRQICLLSIPPSLLGLASYTPFWHPQECRLASWVNNKCELEFIQIGIILAVWTRWHWHCQGCLGRSAPEALVMCLRAFTAWVFRTPNFWRQT